MFPNPKNVDGYCFGGQWVEVGWELLHLLDWFPLVSQNIFSIHAVYFQPLSRANKPILGTLWGVPNTNEYYSPCRANKLC